MFKWIKDCGIKYDLYNKSLMQKKVEKSQKTEHCTMINMMYA